MVHMEPDDQRILADNLPSMPDTTRSLPEGGSPDLSYEAYALKWAADD
jgi:hypothetical protein